MYSTKIERLYQDYNELIDFFREHSQTSFELYINTTYKKTLVLSAASYFEYEITNQILNFAKHTSKNNPILCSFLQNKALSQQYHAMFDWKSNNANKFFALFGLREEARN